MTKKLYLRCKCEILFQGIRSQIHGELQRINIDESDGPYGLNVFIRDRLVHLELENDGISIRGEDVINNPIEEILDIISTADIKNLSNAQQDALTEVLTPFSEAMRQLVLLIKQELPDYRISDESIGNLKYEWSLDNSTWKPTPSGIQMHISMLRIGQLNKEKAKYIQKLLSENEVALVAINHLHRAQAEHGLRYKWIDATIAAELAIKEVLIRMEPKLEVIFRSLPSPPLDRLYGDVLKSIAGTKPSKANIDRLRKGAEKRNALIHRPESIKLDHDEVTSYIDFIDDLIHWLLDLYRRKKRESS